jgi:hypothetical protein
LGPLTKRAQPRNFITFDIESKDGDSQKQGFTRPFAVGMFDGQEYRSFRNDPHVDKMPWEIRAYQRGSCIDKFLRHLFGEVGARTIQSPYKNRDIYAHNLGAFDGLFLPAWLSRQSRRYSFKIVPVQSKIQSLEVWRHDASRLRNTEQERRDADKKDKKRFGTWRFLDSFRILPMGLDKLAKSFGLGGKVEHDLNLDEQHPDWDTYLRGDCEKLWRIVERFKNLIRDMGGDVGITAPATAMKLLRMRFLRQDDLIYRNIHFPDCPSFQKEKPIDLAEIAKQKTREVDEECQGCAHEFFRSAMAGGRTEVFQREGWGWYYDVNSSYPYSMKNPMPAGEMTMLGENENFTGLVDKGRHVGFVRCTVEVPPQCYLPPLPLQLDDKLKFPTGRFSGTWDWVELQSLKKVGGRIIHVEKSAWIEGKKFLVDFVDTLYRFRNKRDPEHDEAKDQTAKIMMNATFGKFGMEQDRQEVVILKQGEPEPWETRYPGESKKLWEQRMEMRSMGYRKVQNTKLKGAWEIYDVKGEQADRPKLNRSMAGPQGVGWRLPELPMPSASFEHDSPVRIRDIHVDAPYIIPQIAAHVTACSRMLLWHYANEMVAAGYKIFYSDTDSILCNSPEIPDSTELGGLKKEFGGERVFVYCYAPKMYYLEKETPFEGEHVIKEISFDEYMPQCLTECPGCKTFKNEKGKTKHLAGEHVTDENGQRLCYVPSKRKFHCPGCAKYKIIMKGFPKEMRRPDVLVALRKSLSVKYRRQERLGTLLRRGLIDTPMMVEVEKSLKSSYDKRVFLPDGDTRPIVLDNVKFLSERFRQVALDPAYQIPRWLVDVLPENPIHPRS